MMLRVGDAAKRHCTPVAVCASASVAVASGADTRSLRRAASGENCTTDAAVGSSVAHETRISSGASPSAMRTCEGAAVEPAQSAAAHTSAAASSRRGPMARRRREQPREGGC